VVGRVPPAQGGGVRGRARHGGNIVLWTVVLFGAALALLFGFWRRLNQRVTER